MNKSTLIVYWNTYTISFAEKESIWNSIVQQGNSAGFNVILIPIGNEGKTRVELITTNEEFKIIKLKVE